MYNNMNFCMLIFFSTPQYLHVILLLLHITMISYPLLHDNIATNLLKQYIYYISEVFPTITTWCWLGLVSATT